MGVYLLRLYNCGYFFIVLSIFIHNKEVKIISLMVFVISLGILFMTDAGIHYYDILSKYGKVAIAGEVISKTSIGVKDGLTISEAQNAIQMAKIKHGSEFIGGAVPCIITSVLLYKVLSSKVKSRGIGF